MKDLSNKSFCSCFSGKHYEDCCLPFHQGTSAPSAEKLMRSRYSAYAKQLYGYIIETTHPQSPYYEKNREVWSKKIILFCTTTMFQGLEILQFQENKTTASVTFIAYLSQNDQDVSFKEKSFFEKLGKKWFYLKKLDEK